MFLQIPLLSLPQAPPHLPLPRQGSGWAELPLSWCLPLLHTSQRHSWTHFQPFHKASCSCEPQIFLLEGISLPCFLAQDLCGHTGISSPLPKESEGGFSSSNPQIKCSGETLLGTFPVCETHDVIFGIVLWRARSWT